MNNGIMAATLQSSPAKEPAVRMEELRRQLAALEAAAAGKCGVLLALGNPAIDGALGGGLGCGALHEIAAVREADVAAASGFALALAVRRAARRGGPIGNSWDARNDARVPSTVLWIAEDLLLAENGALYGPGLEAIGIAPERLITVAAVRGRDVLWAMEEALRCRAVGGPPRFLARLLRNRRGPLGTWIVEWNSVEQRFELATHSEPVAGAAFDRAHRTAVA